MSHKAVLEIGTEEIPAKLIGYIHQNLKETSHQVLSKYRIEVGNIKVLGSPRRLTVLFEDISEYQTDLVEEIKGPPCNIAFDDDGVPTKAATGFAQNQGVEVEDLKVRDTEKGEYLFAIIEHNNKKCSELLTDIFPEIITSLSLPISMRWGDRDFEFIRPIHWLLGLYDNQVIEFAVADIVSGSKSRGHRFLASQEFEIEAVSSYVKQLRENYVIVDVDERREMIIEGIKEIEKETGGQVELDEDLLQEVLHLVEYPTPLCGKFNEKYLELPEPVLVTPIKEHQRYFPVRDNNGDLMARFVAVRDGSEDYLDVVREGNEKVIKARLADAEFYYDKDLEISMEERVEELKGLVFREELGTMYDKVNRIEKFAFWLGGKLDVSQVKLEATKRTAHLAKADLVSQMVGEFPELQGIIGEKYAEIAGEKSEICHAISEHYYPRFAGDRLPESEQGKIISIADRLDTLIGCFGIGLIPTGSEDPYGLRRSAMGVVRILKALEIDINLSELCRNVIRIYEDKGFELSRPEQEIIDDVVGFLLERVEYLLKKQKVRPDVIRAVTTGLAASIPEIFAGVNAYLEFKNEHEFQELVIAYNRVQNIVKERKKDKINPQLLLAEEEKKLYNNYVEISDKISELKLKLRFGEIYEELKSLIEPIHDFFEKVRVMVEEQEIKNNRLNFLVAIRDTMLALGDLSQITVE